MDIVKKKPIKKREVPLTDDVPVESMHNTNISKYAKAITIKATLTSENSAAFDGNFFYNLLKDKITAHKDFLSLNDDIHYIQPFNKTIFKFKLNTRLPWKNKYGSYCMADNLIGVKCNFLVKATPYDFVSDEKKRLVGISIKVYSVVEC